MPAFRVHLVFKSCRKQCDKCVYYTLTQNQTNWEWEFCKIQWNFKLPSEISNCCLKFQKTDEISNQSWKFTSYEYHNVKLVELKFQINFKSNFKKSPDISRRCLWNFTLVSLKFQNGCDICLKFQIHVKFQIIFWLTQIFIWITIRDSL